MTRSSMTGPPLTIATIGHRFADASVESSVAEPFGVTVGNFGHLGKADALAAAHAAHGVLIGLGFELDAPALDALAACRVIVRYGIGLDNVDVSAAEHRGIVVRNVPDYGIEEVANHTMALLLAIARRLDTLSARVRAGDWSSALRGLEMVRLSRQRLLIVGAGRIGRAVADRAAPFWGDVDVFDPFAKRTQWVQSNVRWADDLDEALASADYVTFHVPSAPETRGLLSRQRIASLKRGCVIVNCSRGDVIDEPALIDALAEGHVAAAGLDVFVGEPHPSPRLIAMENVLPTPHAAWFSREAVLDLREKATQAAIEELLRDDNASNPRAQSSPGRG